MKYRITLESLILVAICLTDMLVTLYFVMAGVAREQNPIMAACMNRSPMMFVLVKVISFVPFIIAVEVYRRWNPAFAAAACRCAIVLYLVEYVTLTLGVNLFG